MTERVRVAVVGGGLSGLFTAVELGRRGIEAVVLDAGATPGGVAATVSVDGFSVEPAAGAVTVPHPHMGPILSAAEVDLTPAVDASQRYVLTRRGLVALPASPKAVLSPVVPWHAKLRAAAEPLVRTERPADDETLATFLGRRFGHTAGATLAMLMASGVYAGDPDRLSARSAFPMLAGLETSHGSVLRGALALRRQAPGGPRPASHLPTGGMAAMAATLAGHLGDRHRPGVAVSAVRPGDGGWQVDGDLPMRADHVVVATSPARAAVMLGELLAEVLSQARAAPVAVVALGGRSDEAQGRVIPPGFGYLAAPGASRVAAGCLFESSYAPGRAPDGHWLLKVIAGGARHPQVMGWDDDRLVAETVAEVGAALRVDLAPDFTHVIRHRPGIPQYEVGHSAWLSTLDRLTADRPGLHLTGWAYRGVGLTHLATDAVRIAAEIG
jgi:oxygen-dependent protoporphyrinogen oxidase